MPSPKPLRNIQKPKKLRYKDWGEVFRAAVRRGDDHGYAAFLADNWDMRRGNPRPGYAMKNETNDSMSINKDSVSPFYTKSDPGELWWCNVHRCVAHSILHRDGMDLHHCCDPDLPGITIPCKCSNITEFALKFARQ